MDNQIMLWLVFNVLVAGMLYIDLFWAQKKSHVIGMREAAVWSVVWVIVSLLFCVGIYFVMSPEKALQFLTGYIIEKSLSVDNMFVFIMIFSYFGIGPLYQPRVLKWGILGALILRFVMILAGVALIERFHWILYVFGAFLIYTAFKMAFEEEKEFDPEKSFVFRKIKKILPMTGFHEEKFFYVVNGVRCATPLFLAIIFVEISDVVFALDSIPAIFAITTDTFIVYTSNVFAILGLRALFFLLSGMVRMFVYLKYGVAIVLAYVGIKMLIMDLIHIPTVVSLGVVVIVLTLSVVLSLLVKNKQTQAV